MAQGDTTGEVKAAAAKHVNSEKEEPEVSTSLPRGQHHTMQEPPGGSLLDYVLNQKKLELLQSPEVIRFLRGQQVNKRKERLSGSSKEAETERDKRTAFVSVNSYNLTNTDMSPERVGGAKSVGQSLFVGETKAPSTAYTPSLQAGVGMLRGTDSEHTALVGLQELQSASVSSAFSRGVSTSSQPPPVKMARIDNQDCVKTVMANSGGSGTIAPGAPVSVKVQMDSIRALSSHSSGMGPLVSAPRVVPTVSGAVYEPRPSVLASHPSHDTLTGRVHYLDRGLKQGKTSQADQPNASRILRSGETEGEDVSEQQSTATLTSKPGIWSRGASAFTTVTKMNFQKH